MMPAAHTLALTASLGVFSGRGLVRGWSLRNDHATDACVVTLYDGVSTSGNIVSAIEIAAGHDDQQFPGSGAFRVERGLYVGISGGTLAGTVMYNTETRLLHELALFDDGTEDVTEFAFYRWLAALGGA